MSIKHIEPKTIAAQRFVAKYGNIFHIVALNPLTIFSVESGQPLTVEDREGGIYVNGSLFCEKGWVDKKEKGNV